MIITLKYETLCSILWNLPTTNTNFFEAISDFIKVTYNVKLNAEGTSQMQRFLKIYDVKMKSVDNKVIRFKRKFSDWMDVECSGYKISSGAPFKAYVSLCTKSKKKRLAEKLSVATNEEVCDTFKEMLKKENQPKDALHIADVLPNASPKRLKRIVESIHTPPSHSSFTEEEAIALMLELGLSRNKYQILRKALLEKDTLFFHHIRTSKRKNKQYCLQ